MSWLENPTVAAILGSIAGAVLSALVSVLIWRGSRKRRRIRAIIRDVTSLLEISPQLKESLKMEANGKAIDSLFLTSLDIVNKGNTSLTDQNVVINFPQGTEILDYSISTEPDVGFQRPSTNNTNNEINADIKLLNIGEKVTFEIVSTGNNSDTVHISMRNIDVEEEVIDARDEEFHLSNLLSENNLVMLAVVSSIPFLGGFARSMINVGVANRIDKLGRR